MGIRDILKKLKPEEDAVEFPEETETAQQVNIRIENLTDFVDIDRIMRLVKDGNIVFLKTKDLQRHDIGEFQNSVQKLKRVCGQFGFGIVGTEEGYLLLTPGFAKIER